MSKHNDNKATEPFNREGADPKSFHNAHMMTHISEQQQLSSAIGMPGINDQHRFFQGTPNILYSDHKGGEQVDDDDDDSDSDDETVAPGSESIGRWTRQEHELFLQALRKYGKEWKKVASMVKTRTVVQTRTHAQKYFQKMNKPGGRGSGSITLLSAEDMGSLGDTTSISTNKQAVSIRASGGSGSSGESGIGKRGRKPSSGVSIASDFRSRTAALNQFRLQSESKNNGGIDTDGILRLSQTPQTFEMDNTEPSVAAAAALMSRNYEIMKNLAEQQLSEYNDVGASHCYENNDREMYDSYDPNSVISSHISGADTPILAAIAKVGVDKEGKYEQSIFQRPSNIVNGLSQAAALSVPIGIMRQRGTSDIPQPSPAACGSRKKAELNAAQMLVSGSSTNMGPPSLLSTTSLDMEEGVQTLSMMKKGLIKTANEFDSVPGKRNASNGNIVDLGSHKKVKQISGLSLSIADPSDIPFVEGQSQKEPETPWDNAVRLLEAEGEKNRPYYNSNFSLENVTVSTPAEQRSFLHKVRMCIKEGELESLTALLKAADISAQRFFANDDTAVGNVNIHSMNNTFPEGGEIVKMDSNLSVSNLMSDYTPNVTEGSMRSRAASEKDVAAKNAERETSIQLSPTGSEAGADNGANCRNTGKAESFRHLKGFNYRMRSPAALVAKSLNGAFDKGRSVLMEVILQDSLRIDEKLKFSMCKLLLDHGAAVYHADDAGDTCLHYAARYGGLLRIGRMLLTKGCPINQQNIGGDCATHIAARLGHASFLEMLANLGANFHIRNGNAMSALDLAGSSLKDPNLRQQIRTSMLRAEPRLRTLVLYHDDFMSHIARRASDWEGPDRLTAIMNNLRDQNKFPSYELEISSNFQKADVTLLGRVHSAEYIAFVNTLAKEVTVGASTEDEDEFRPPAPPLPFTPQVQKFLKRQASEELKHSEDCDTSFSAGTLNAARRAAGAVAHAVDRVLLGRNRNAFCVIRPPGHHAGYRGMLDGTNSCGFCIFNNVAAGALHALEEHNCERVAIVDIDVHHGNGTEDIVRRYAHPSKLFFFSSHLYDKQDSSSQDVIKNENKSERKSIATNYEFYPGTGGRDDNLCNIINAPIMPLWRADEGAESLDTNDVNSSEKQSKQRSDGGVKLRNSTGSPESLQLNSKNFFYGREGFRQAIQQRLVPALRAFNPSLILLSTGFDAAKGDVGNTKYIAPQSRPGSNRNSVIQGKHEAGIDLNAEDYAWATAEIMRIADICCSGRLVSVLEGGYGEYSAVKTQPNGSFPTTRSSNSNNAAEKKKIDLAADSGAPSGSTMKRDLLATMAVKHTQVLVDPVEFGRGAK